VFDVQAAESRIRWCKAMGPPYYEFNKITGRSEYGFVTKAHMQEFGRKKANECD
jgi:hypothetical protein